MDSAILIVWAVFWAGWLISAFAAKPSVGRRRPARPIAIVIIAIAWVVLRSFRTHGGTSLMIHAPAVRAIGAALVLCGLGTAVWARVVMGRDWGMPMSEKEQPELVTAGPYGLIRHPIYSGLILAMIGTALAVTLGWLIVAAGLGGYFVYSATVEERNLDAQFPGTYQRYRERTKMLIPFLL